MGAKAERVEWVASDVLRFQPTVPFDVWHDRATFHFLTTPTQITRYLDLAHTAVRSEGYLTMGTFSTNGPTKCSRLDVRQYSEETLTNALQQGFDKLRCRTENHVTPFQTMQNFLFCSFQRRASSLLT